MAEKDYLGRWIDLAAYLLTQPEVHDPLVEVCAELSARFDCAAAGIADYGDRIARLGAYRYPETGWGQYAPVLGDHPLALHYRETGDQHARTLEDARRFQNDRWAQRLLSDLREDGLRDYIYVPLLPRTSMTHRWLGLGSDSSVGPTALAEVNRLAPLIRAIDRQNTMVTTAFEEAGRMRSRELGLSARELAVLGLIARGMTATAIASNLQISPRTVSKHQQNIYRKLDVCDRLAAVLRAQELGILARPALATTAVAMVEAQPVRRQR